MITAQPGVTVVVHKDREDETSRLPAGVRVVSIICLAIGVLALVTQSLIEAVRGRALYTFYEGFVEAGLLFGIGGIGLWALRSPSRNKSSAFLGKIPENLHFVKDGILFLDVIS